MPIKPMDMQVMLPQVQKAAKSETQKNSRQDMAVSNQHLEQNKDDKVKRNKVANLEKKDDHKLKNDQEGHGSKKKKKKKKKKNNETEKEKKEKPVIKHGFDMKV